MATISFLQRFEPLTNDEVRRLIGAYESRSGKWYIAAYTDGVALAISQAAEKAVRDLK